MVDWEGQLGLYKQLLLTPSLLGQHRLIDTFYYHAQSGLIGQYQEVDAAIANINQFPAPLESDIEDAWESFQVYKDSFENHIAGIASIENANDRLDAYRMADSIRSAGLVEYALFLGYKHIADSLRDINIAEALELNDELPVNDILQENRKTINRIYLGTLAKNITELTEEQFEDVSAIANQCPFEGGKAVYRARSLYTLREDRSFNDSLLCLQAEERQAKSAMKRQGSKGNLSIVPNPARDKVQIFLPDHQEIDQEIILKIIGTNGQTIVHRHVRVVNEVISLDVSQFPGGLYTCVISGTGISADPAKFIVHH